MDAKKALRQQVETARTGQPGPDLEPALASLLNGARQIASYVGLGSEPYVSPRAGWFLPVLLPDDDLDWARYDGELTTGQRGLLEPPGRRLGLDAIAGCDVVLVPALAVDLAGYRLGRGGGSYDRALARATGLTVALLHDGELLDAVPHEHHDIRVHAVATPVRGLVRLS